MEQRPVIFALGLQRSGNHAVLGWIGSLFDRAEFHNDVRHDLLADPARLAEILGGDEDCTIVSFEDSANRTERPQVALVDSVVLPAQTERPTVRVVILRDPYNTWASRVAANTRAKGFGRALTSNPSWPQFRENWMRLAARAEDPDWLVIRFNRWVREEAYRREICALLGGRYDEAALEQVPMQGGGSSFDGVPRPSYGDMLRQWRKYVSRPFLLRLVSRPSHYVRRFVLSPPTGRDLRVDYRWESLVGRPEAEALFSDADLAGVTGRLFEAEAVPPRVGA